MGYKAAVQVLKQADVLKAKLCKNCDPLNDSEIWVNQQQLQTIYHQVLVLDLEYALDKKVEQELWTLGFKNQITTLQELAKDKKNPKRQDLQALLSWCLESASGFYLTLLQELCTTFDLDLPFRRTGVVYGQLKSYSCEQMPQSSSCMYICQYCLVHLGDIARYRNQRRQAENFYKQAILVSPTSGQPYNQLALLEASQGNKLSTVFHYVRAIAVKNPFPVSSTNLSTTLTSAMDKDDPITEVQTKMSVSKLIRLFLHIHGLLRTTSELDRAEIGVKSINATLTALVATQSFTSDKLLKMTAINMYGLWNIVGVDITNMKDLTTDEKRTCILILDLIAGSLSAFLLPIYTLKSDETLLEYYALPAIKLIFCWIQKFPDVLNDTVFSNRLQIWPSFCKLLNNVQEHLKDFQCEDTIPLSEDRELEGFLPLSESFKSLNFKYEPAPTVGVSSEKFIRAKRLVDFGIWLTSHKVNGSNLIITTKTESNMTFEPGCIQPDPTDQLLELMKSVNVNDVAETKKTKATNEKRTGILKPQGSLERSREEREQNAEIIETSIVTKTDQSKIKRMKQNVALQSIFKKMEENKQVKFSEETTDKNGDKNKPRPQPSNSQLPQQSQQPLPPPPQLKPQISAPSILPQQQYRTQTFNQNHPGLSTNIHQDFFTSTPSVQSLAKIGEIAPPPTQNLYYQNNDMKNTLANTLSKIPQTMQYAVPPPPTRMVPNLPTAQNANQYNQMPYRPGPWPPDERSWWSNQQKDRFAQPPPPQQQHFPPPVDYGQQQQQNVPAFNMWGNSSRVGPHLGGFNQNLSMRQAMLNEAKHIEGVQQHGVNPPAPGYSLFDTNWHPSLPIRSGEQQRPVGGGAHHSLFSGPPLTSSSLKQLLEQQNLFQKGDNK